MFENKKDFSDSNILSTETRAYLGWNHLEMLIFWIQARNDWPNAIWTRAVEIDAQVLGNPKTPIYDYFCSISQNIAKQVDRLDPGGIGCNLFRLFLPNFSKINKKLYQIVNCSTSGLKRFYLILESNWLTDHKFPNSLQGWVMPPKKNLDDIPPPPPIVFF